MYQFKNGDLIAQVYQGGKLILKTGIIIQSQRDTFVVKWTNYNKSFFMEKEEDIFAELNNMYLLSMQSINRAATGANLCLLNAS